MLQKWPIALPQLKAGKMSDNLLDEIRQILCTDQMKKLKKKIAI